MSERREEGAAAAANPAETLPLRELLCDAADELEAVYRNQYGFYHPDGIHPAMQHKFDRDMELVVQLRGASGALPRESAKSPNSDSRAASSGERVTEAEVERAGRVFDAKRDEIGTGDPNVDELNACIRVVLEDFIARRSHSKGAS